jgi:hypothetical protein
VHEAYLRLVDTDNAQLGNGIEALESVPTAIASLALTPESDEETVGNVILLGVVRFWYHGPGTVSWRPRWGTTAAPPPMVRDVLLIA